MEDVSAKWYWVPHPKYSYVPAKLVKELGPSCILQSYLDGEELTYPTKHIDELSLASEQSLPGNIENLTALNEFTEGAIVHQLRCRYGNNTIYTSVGDILVSVNPYKMLPIYTSNVLFQYLNQGQSSAQLPPHIFATASGALEGLLRDDENQSIVISGESGAGKTEATKLILQFLGDVAGDTVDEVQQIVLESQPLLEAFGNAKTLRNNNSSRFGKWVEVTFDEGRVSGGRMFNYSLEKARVVYQLKGERNYHSFYYLLAGLSKDKLRQIGLDESQSYRYLNMSGNMDLGSGNDHEEFQSMMNAFDHMDFEKNTVTEIFRVLSVILNLGNVKLEEQQDHDGSVIMNPGQVDRCATVLRVDRDKLQRALLHRTVTVGSDTAYVPLRVSDSTNSRDAVAKAMYSKLFDWLVRRVNNCLERSNSKRFIGLLDIFGFEIFDNNGFEQFCINYANEKFQQFFNSQIMKMEQQEYKDNGIDIEYIDFVDNQATLDMIEDRRMGIFAMLDEQVSLPKGNDKQFVDNLHKKFAAVTKHPSYLRVKKNNDLFCVKHFAGTVAYNSKGMVEKNSDKLHTIWSDLLATSKSNLIVKLFAGDVEKANGAPPQCRKPPRSPRGGNRKKLSTLSGHFKTEIADLLSTIRATQPHFVRCIKPNKDKLADTFDSNMVLEQLKAAGLFEAVKIRKSGFEFRKDHSQFVARYMVCIPKSLRSPQEGSDDKKKCEQIVSSLGEDIDPADIQIGTSKVFYRTRPMDLLERYRDEALFAVATLIQKIIRGYMARKKFRRVEKVYKSLKAAIESRQLAELNAAVELAERLSIDIYAVKQAKAAEKEIINEAHKTLKEAMQQKDLESLNLAIEYGEEIRLADFANQDVTATIVEAEELRGLLREKQAAEQRLKDALDEFDLETLIPTIELAERLGVAAEILESAYDLRNDLEYEESLFDALRDATATKDLAKVEGVLGACSDLRPNDKREKALEEARAFIVRYFAAKIEKAIKNDEEADVQRALRDTRHRNLQVQLEAQVKGGEAYLVEQERRREEARRIAEQERRAEEAMKAKQRKLEEERLARMKAEAEAKRRAAEAAEAERVRLQKEKAEVERKRRQREELQRVETIRLQQEETERFRRESEERQRQEKAEIERKELEEKRNMLLQEQEERVIMAREDEDRAKRAQEALGGRPADAAAEGTAEGTDTGDAAGVAGEQVEEETAGGAAAPTSPRLSAIAAQHSLSGSGSLSPPASPQVGPEVPVTPKDSMRRFMDTFGRKTTDRRNSLSAASSAGSVGTLSRMSTSASLGGLEDDDSVTVPCAACSSINSYRESKLDGYRMVKCLYCSHFWVPPPVETEMPPTVSFVNPDHTGMMKKRGVKTFKKSWKTRYCIVHEDYLYWMKSARDEFPLGRLRLAEEGLQVKIMDSKTTQITTSVKKYVFQTKQAMQMAEWLAAFTRVVDRARESRQANTLAKSPTFGTKGRSTRKGTFNKFQRITVKSAIGRIARDFKGLFTLLDIDRALAYRFAEREIDRKMLGKISFAELRDIVPEIIPLTVILEYIKLKIKHNALADLKENCFDVTFNARPLGFEVLNKSLIIVNVERGSLAEECGVVRGCRIIVCNGFEATIERIMHPGMPMALTFATYTSWEDEPPEAKEAYDKAEAAAIEAAMETESSRSAARGDAPQQPPHQPGSGPPPPPPNRALPNMPGSPYGDDGKQDPAMEVEEDPMGDHFQTLGLENEMEDYTPFFERLKGQHRLKDFSLLRDPEDFAKKSRRREKTMRNMLVWQKDLIPRPLLEIDPAYCGGDLQAVRYVKFTGRELFKKILGYMRDRYHATPVTLAYEVVHTGVQEPLLRDTIFTILIKQTTNNPLARSELLGWKLMYMCLSSFAPSAELSLIILSHIASGAQSRPPDTVSSFSTCEDAAFACFRQFRRTTMIGPRDEPPPIVEIEAFTEFNSVALKVYTEDGRYHRVTLSAGDATTIGDVKEHMCGLVGIQGDTSSFEIQVQCEDRSPTRAPSGPKSFFKRKEQEQIAESAMVDTFMIPPNKQVFLCLSEWEDESVKNSNLKYSIIFRKSRYESKDKMPTNEDPGYIQMIYFQAQSDVRSGRFQLELQTLAKLASVQLAIEQGLMQADECVSLMSFPELAAYLPFFGLTAMSFEDWKLNLRNEIGSLLESAPHQSAEDQMHYFYLTYIAMVNEQPLYGCSYFYGQLHPELNGTPMGERVCLAVNWKGVSVVNSSSYEHIAFMPLESIDKLVLIQRNSLQFLAHTEKLSYVQLFTITSSNAQGCYELLDQLVRAYKQMSNF